MYIYYTLKKLIIILPVLLLYFNIVKAQGGFNKNYLISGVYSAVCSDLFETPNGNIVTVGYTVDNVTGANQLSILCTNAQGNKLWNKNLGNIKFEYYEYYGIYSRSIINANNCFYLYSIARDSNNKWLSVLVKFNFTGDTLWQKKYYDSIDYVYIQSVIKSVDNGFLMTGEFSHPTNPVTQTMLIKTDSMGNELWRKKISKSLPNGQSGHNLIQDSATKKIVIVGDQYNGTVSAYTNYANIIVTDSLGNVLQRVSNWGGTFKDVIQTKDKNIVAVGVKNQWNDSPGGFPRTKGFAVKFNLNNINSIIWQKEFDTLSIYNEIATVNELKNGDLILGGMLDTLSNYKVREKGMLRLIKLDKDGNVKWKKLYSKDSTTANSKKARSLNLTQDGGFLIANELYLATNPRPYSITKIDSTGCDSTLAYCSTVGLNEFASTGSATVRVYPNPTNGILSLDIEYGTRIKVINVLGEIVKEEELKYTNQYVYITSLKNGIYFLQVFDKDKLIGITKIIKE